MAMVPETAHIQRIATELDAILGNTSDSPGNNLPPDIEGLAALRAVHHRRASCNATPASPARSAPVQEAYADHLGEPSNKAYTLRGRGSHQLMRLVSKCLWWYTRSIRTALVQLDRTVSERAEELARGQDARIDDLNTSIGLLAVEIRAIHEAQAAAAKEADRLRRDLLTIGDEAAEWRTMLKRFRK